MKIILRDYDERSSICGIITLGEDVDVEDMQEAIQKAKELLWLKEKHNEDYCWTVKDVLDILKDKIDFEFETVRDDGLYI